MSDFDSLLKWGNIGFYSRCEITNIFVLDKKSGDVYNYFTVFVMEDNTSIESAVKNVTPELITLSKRFSIGITQSQVEVSSAKRIYESLLLKSQDKCNIGQGNLCIGQLKPLTRQFVQPDSTIEPILNKVIKNNYFNGSYILEFFDMTKPLQSMLTLQETREASLAIQDAIPIDLFAISDRIGNIIFQFPAQVVSATFSPDRNDQSLILELYRDKRNDIHKRYCAIAHHLFENVLVGHNIQFNIDANTCKLQIDDVDGLNCVQIINEDNGLIVYMNSARFLSQVSIASHIGMRFGAERTICGEILQVYLRELLHIPKETSTDWKDFSRKRQYQMSLKELESQMKFIQYGTNGPETEKAIRNVRELIQRRDAPKIYLWDPYLSANDILKTLYFSPNYGTELKAISSHLAHAKKTASEWIREQKEVFESQSNNYGINLVFRLQHENKGFPFHDRFLIFIDDYDVSRVWSLGTSVNGLGGKHHILQEVNNPQHIVDAFEKLWGQLDDDTCLIWSSKK